MLFEGLGEVVGCPDGARMDAVQEAIPAGQHDNGSPTESVGLTQHCTEFIAIQFGHRNVAQDEIGAEAEERTEGGDWSWESCGAVAQGLERFFNRLTHCAAVFYAGNEGGGDRLPERRLDDPAPPAPWEDRSTE